MNQTYTVNLNRDTFELLHGVRDEMSDKLGFEPTLGQVVRHLISVYRNNPEQIDNVSMSSRSMK
jgi:hypothetical protein